MVQSHVLTRPRLERLNERLDCLAAIHTVPKSDWSTASWRELLELVAQEHAS